MNSILKTKIVESVVDIGSGLGESTLTLFHDFPNIKEIIGYEIVYSRFYMNLLLLKNYVDYYNQNIENSLTFVSTKNTAVVLDLTHGRKIEIRNYALPIKETTEQYDLYFLDVEILNLPSSIRVLLKNAPKNSIIISYNDLKKFGINLTLFSLPRIDTSWAKLRGHLFNSYINTPLSKEMFSNNVTPNTCSTHISNSIFYLILMIITIWILIQIYKKYKMYLKK